jgi:hypothetical protein
LIVIAFVNGLTVNLTVFGTMLVVAVVCELPPTVRVPPFAFGEPFGSSWVVAMLNVVGPFA